MGAVPEGKEAERRDTRGALRQVTDRQILRLLEEGKGLTWYRARWRRVSCWALLALETALGQGTG